MKIIKSSLLAIFFLSFGLNASTINMACVTEYPTTSFVAFVEGNILTIRLIHHNGVKYMPIWSGVVTPNDLPVITETANLLSELGDILEFKIPASECAMNGMMMNCFGRSEIQEINGHKINLWAVYTAVDFEKSFAGEYNYVSSNLAVDIDGKSYWLPMKYYNYECFQELSASSLKKKALTKKLFLK